MKIKVLSSNGQIAEFKDDKISMTAADVEVDAVSYVSKTLIAQEEFKQLLWFQIASIMSLVAFTCSKIDGLVGLMAIGVGLMTNAGIFYIVVKKRQYLQQKYNVK
jgi:hypothetical protein